MKPKLIQYCGNDYIVSLVNPLGYSHTAGGRGVVTFEIESSEIRRINQMLSDMMSDGLLVCYNSILNAPGRAPRWKVSMFQGAYAACVGDVGTDNNYSADRVEPPKCDCGAHACGYGHTPSSSHSPWCEVMTAGQLPE